MIYKRKFILSNCYLVTTSIYLIFIAFSYFLISFFSHSIFSIHLFDAALIVIIGATTFFWFPKAIAPFIESFSWITCWISIFNSSPKTKRDFTVPWFGISNFGIFYLMKSSFNSTIS